MLKKRNLFLFILFTLVLTTKINCIYKVIINTTNSIAYQNEWDTCIPENNINKDNVHYNIDKFCENYLNSLKINYETISLTPIDNNYRFYCYSNIEAEHNLTSNTYKAFVDRYVTDNKYYAFQQGILNEEKAKELFELFEAYYNIQKDKNIKIKIIGEKIEQEKNNEKKENKTCSLATITEEKE